ncbi:DHA2 family efflux MFS transporter permease subunit [Brevibacillus laterosporus]|uniref:Drug resistance transporter, EmrB/QacA subfamily protein n=1 Tax=Brevibacillus laterosporus LMG 15441 TaxID=1042163 RepID=A0A075QXD5_BRELA|nr:MDR family MFS transporter [Brevibacillus laterosporus]AIG25047.1 drug resistance transporter, EmrB/QacA subfamily protein [Brevibacillus laterosporus LMG 15441]RJL08282.1 MFS transporter [Brevibacillus laterosporus]TPH16273.1 DHA2 family efflux MFS transporter permease subunit [Brevibacillus laterosporus]HAS01937.1 MFS transporter [Brevibacillus sp.]
MVRSKRSILTALMVTTFLTAIDTTVVTTAMPAIANDLGQTTLISWVFSIYLLTTAVTTPIYGKLADLFGRKKIFLFGTTVFLTGSFLCGLSGSMTQLMLYRGIQGLGAGAVQPITMTIIGDLFTQEERAKLMGLFSAVWGVAAIVGPVIGGFFVDYVAWEWIFYINIPIGLVSIFMISKYFKEELTPKTVHIDYWGALFFTGSLVSFLYTLLAEGEGQGITFNATTISLLIVSLVLFCIFLAIERRTPEPMLPLPLFKRRLIATSQAISVLHGALLIGVSVYMPNWLINIVGLSATLAGIVVLPLSLGWPLAASVGGRYYSRLGYKWLVAIGGVFFLIGQLLLSFLTPATSVFYIGFLMFILGLGFGLTMTAITIAVQSSVVWRQRGVATSSVQFMRTMGQTVGITMFGAVFNMYLLQGHMETGLIKVFHALFVTAIIGMFVTILLPKKAEQVEEER